MIERALGRERSAAETKPVAGASLRISRQLAGRLRATQCCVVAIAMAIAGCSEQAGPASGPNAAGSADARSQGETAAAKGTGDRGAASAVERPAGAATAGDPAAEDVTVRQVTPDEFKEVIANQKGSVVLVDFWATYCGPCREKYPGTLALGKKYADQGLKVVSMSMDGPDPDDQKKILRFLQEQKSHVTNLANRLEDTDKAFGAHDIDGGALPHYKVFDRKGKLRAKFGGDPDRPFDEKDIEAAVVAALKEG